MKTFKIFKKIFLVIILSLLGVFVVYTISTGIFYWYDFKSNSYSGSRVYKLYLPTINLNGNRCFLYQGYDCLFIGLNWMAQYSFKENDLEIDDLYSNKWEDFIFPTKAPGFLVRQYQIPPFFKDVYKDFGENRDNYPLIKYGVNTSVFIYIEKWTH
jgi:hypothetical protein